MITHHAQAKKGVNWGVISSDKYNTERIEMVQSNAVGTWAGAPCCGSRQLARRPSHAAAHATGSTPPGPVPLSYCLRQWLRLRREVLRLRLPRGYSCGGAETYWQPSGSLFCACYPAARTSYKPDCFRAPAP